MESAPTAPVTAQRVRDGEPAALGALVERRGTAVLAYCEAVAEPGSVTAAAGEAFARFRREVVAADEPRALDPEAVLLRGTRQAAAAAAPRSVAPGGLLARRLGATCVLVPELLAARAERTLTTADRLRLARHLERCASCREAQERFLAGEQAWREAPNTPPPAEVADQLLAALRGAAPVAKRSADAEPAASNGAPPAVALGGADGPTLAWDASDIAAAGEESPGRSWGWVATRIIVPSVVFAVAFVVALAIAGVFGGGDGSGAGSIETQSTAPPGRLRVHDRAVTTPLPDGAAIGAVPSAPAPSDQTASAPTATTEAAVPVARRVAAPAPELSASVRSHAESAAPPPSPSVTSTTPGFQPSTTAAPPPAP